MLCFAAVGVESKVDLMAFCSNFGEIILLVPLNSGSGSCFLVVCDREWWPILTMVVPPSDFCDNGAVSPVKACPNKFQLKLLLLLCPTWSGKTMIHGA